MRKNVFTAVATALMVLAIVAAPSAGAVTYTISLQTDASSYSGAQTLTASGAVSPAPGPNTAIFLKIVNPSGTSVAVDSASVNGSTGAYQDKFVLGGSSNWVAGTYTINATWGNSASVPVIFKTVSFTYSPTTTTSSTSTTSTTTSTSSTTTTSSTSTTTTSSSITSTTTSQTSTTTVTTTSTTSTTSSSSSSSTTSTKTTTSSSTQGGGGGIPEFPYQILAVTFFTFILVASYLLARQRRIPGGKAVRL